MADGHHLKIVKSQYLSNRLAAHREIWRDDHGPLTLLCNPIHYTYCYS